MAWMLLASIPKKEKTCAALWTRDVRVKNCHKCEPHGTGWFRLVPVTGIINCHKETYQDGVNMSNSLRAFQQAIFDRIAPWFPTHFPIFDCAWAIVLAYGSEASFLADDRKCIILTRAECFRRSLRPEAVPRWGTLFAEYDAEGILDYQFGMGDDLFRMPLHQGRNTWARGCAGTLPEYSRTQIRYGLSLSCVYGWSRIFIFYECGLISISDPRSRENHCIRISPLVAKAPGMLSSRNWEYWP